MSKVINCFIYSFCHVKCFWGERERERERERENCRQGWWLVAIYWHRSSNPFRWLWPSIERPLWEDGFMWSKLMQHYWLIYIDTDLWRGSRSKCTWWMLFSHFITIEVFRVKKKSTFNMIIIIITLLDFDKYLMEEKWLAIGVFLTRDC